jgi:hypothetical protein
MTEELLRKAYIELEAVKRISLRDCGVSYVDERLLSELKLALESEDETP